MRIWNFLANCPPTCVSLAFRTERWGMEGLDHWTSQRRPGHDGICLLGALWVLRGKRKQLSNEKREVRVSCGWGSWRYLKMEALKTVMLYRGLKAGWGPKTAIKIGKFQICSDGCDYEWT